MKFYLFFDFCFYCVEIYLLLNPPPAFQFVCGPPSPRAANKLEGKWKVRTTKKPPPSMDSNGLTHTSALCFVLPLLEGKCCKLREISDSLRRENLRRTPVKIMRLYMTNLRRYEEWRFFHFVFHPTGGQTTMWAMGKVRSRLLTERQGSRELFSAGMTKGKSTAAPQSPLLSLHSRFAVYTAYNSYSHLHWWWRSTESASRFFPSLWFC